MAGCTAWRGTLDDASNTGYRAPVVPGQPACLLYALEHYGSGRLSRAQVMQPAIRLAEEGFDVDPYQAQMVAFAMRRLRAFPETMRTFFVDDGVPPVPATSTRDADRLVQTNLARTLRALAADGPAALYSGEIGEQLVADLQAHGGLITRDDLAAYSVRELRTARDHLSRAPTPGSVADLRQHDCLRGSADPRAVRSDAAGQSAPQRRFT